MNHEALIARQRSYFTTGATRSLEFRRGALERLGAAIEARESEILTALHADLGKPALDAWTSEIGLVLGEIRHALKQLKKWMKPRRAKVPMLAWPGKARVGREPCGVILILGPWNFPLGLAFGPLAAAIAAGNCAVVKLTDLCPATAKVAARIIAEAFDENEVALIEGDVSVATALLELPFNHVFFTGSTRVGKIVMTAAAKHLASVTLELGGKSPVILDTGADIDKVAAQLAGAKQFNGGQACISPDYVFVREEQQARLVEGFKTNVAKNLYDESGAIRKESIAQIVNQANFNRVKALFDDAVAQGATVAVGGTMDESDLTIHPTLLTGVTPQMKILQEEIFAPVLPVMNYETIDQAIDYIAARDKPLALYIYSDDEAAIEKVISRTS
ncbi:MAG: aldehyde dehydrogenase, partial [Verrucomicrobiales bacterium VVV1]